MKITDKRNKEYVGICELPGGSVFLSSGRYYIITKDPNDYCVADKDSITCIKADTGEIDIFGDGVYVTPVTAELAIL